MIDGAVMTKAKHVPKVYFHLPELAERWGLSMDELLSKALAGDTSGSDSALRGSQSESKAEYGSRP